MTWRVGEYCTFTGITYTTEEFHTEQQAVERAKMICRRYKSDMVNGIGATLKPDGSRIFLAQGAHYGAKLWEFDLGSPLQTEHRERENADLLELRGEAEDLAGLPYLSQSDLRPVFGPVSGASMPEVSDREEEAGLTGGDVPKDFLILSGLNQSDMKEFAEKQEKGGD